MIDVTYPELDAIIRSDYSAFVEKAFETVSPTTPYSRNWHIEELCTVCQSILLGPGRRIVINAPPRSLKSFLLSVAFPAYLLGHNPSYKIICASYSDTIAVKFASDCRRIIGANWFERAFGKLSLLKDTESEIATTSGGYRFTTSVGGSLTGRGGDLIIIDDPLSANEAQSKASRESVNEWFRTTVPSRLDNPATGTIVVVMQRLHVDDLSGFLLSQGGWEHLTFPAIAPEDRTVQLNGARKVTWKRGEPLHPARLPQAELDRQKAALGTAAFSAQYLQAAVPPEGGMLKRSWLRFEDSQPLRQSRDHVIQSWDTALKARDGNDYSVGLTFLKRGPNEIYLTDVVRSRMEFPELTERVVHEASKRAADAILIEDHGSGTSLIQFVQPKRSGVIGISHHNDKVTRMYAATPLLEGGLLRLPKDAPWLDDFLDEYLAFPNGRYDDQIDALSQFLNWNATKKDPYFQVFWD